MQTVLVDAAKGVKVGEAVSRSAKSLRNIIASDEIGLAISRHSQTWMAEASQLSKAQWQGVGSLLKASPAAAERALTIMGVGEAQELGQSAVREFIGKVVASNEKALAQSGFIDDLALKYAHAEKAMAQMPKTTLDQEVWRGVSKTAMVDGKQIQLTLDDVFKVHPGNQMSSHRFSVGGPEGEMALYATLGEKKAAIEIIEKETKLRAKTDLIIASQRIQSQKVLDLTNTEQLQKSGFLDFVNSAITSNLHFDGQIIGNVARKQGFEVIIAPSHFGSGGINVIVLK